MALIKHSHASIDTLSLGNVHDGLQEELIDGLESVSKSINPKFFYDDQGSALFARICDLPEYYLTRTEIGILKRNAEEIADLAGEGCVLIEPGAGSCEKVRYLLNALDLQAYIPLDISAEFLQNATRELSNEFPELNVLPMAIDFNSDIEVVDSALSGRRVLFYPGSTIGNFTPTEALQFLRRMCKVVGAGGGLIVGVDLHKDVDILDVAYNDSQGITAEFNRNILHHVNRLLAADFKPDFFEHKAFYNERERRIEMHLISAVSQIVNCGNGQIHFAEGEGILTEYSYKYTVEDFADLAAQAGFELKRSWLDDDQLFSVLFFRHSA